MNKLLWLLILMLAACQVQEAQQTGEPESTPADPYILVLGIAQDAGYPQADCRKECCRAVWDDDSRRRLVSCLAIVDPESGRSWLLDATPDFREQLRHLQTYSGTELAGIFLTHAHIGHYTGLMQLGREVMGADHMPVFVMPRMQTFLQDNGPWSQLVDLDNISLRPMQADSSIRLSERLRIRPFLVPHRDEFSETVGYQIEGPERSAVFIPDIDKWEKWDRPVDSLVSSVDYAFLDGSFYQNGEIPGRDMSEIPHPFILESIELFESKGVDPGRIFFMHFNHTNPVLRMDSPERKEVERRGFHIAEQGQWVVL